MHGEPPAGAADRIEDAIARRGLTRVLPPDIWHALVEAMSDPAVMPFRPAYQIKHVDAAGPYPPGFDPEAVSYLGDYREGLLPDAASIEWVRIMTWTLVRNERYARYGKFRHEGPGRRLSCEAELRAALDALRIPYTPDGTGCLVIRAIADPGAAA